ncbi:MAG: VWA domain-containing protein, partial [Bacteroidota bacterium]
AGQSTVVILSDGLDTGKPEMLAEELNKIRLRTSKVIWLNPLKGMEGYAPTARGMEAALPHLDVFQSAHNLDSLLELEQLLINV